jgi:hypothetical protein
MPALAINHNNQDLLCLMVVGQKNSNPAAVSWS